MFLVNGKEGSKKKIIKLLEVKFEFYLLFCVDYFLWVFLCILVIFSCEGYVRWILLCFLFEKVNEEFFIRVIRIGMDYSLRKFKYFGIKVLSGVKDRLKSFGKFLFLNVLIVCKKIDKLGGYCLEDGMDDMVLLKVIINEVL